jgi:hypothetical protein
VEPVKEGEVRAVGVGVLVGVGWGVEEVVVAVVEMGKVAGGLEEQVKEVALVVAGLVEVEVVVGLGVVAQAGQVKEAVVVVGLVEEQAREEVAQEVVVEVGWVRVVAGLEVRGKGEVMAVGWVGLEGGLWAMAGKVAEARVELLVEIVG